VREQPDGRAAPDKGRPSGTVCVSDENNTHPSSIIDPIMFQFPGFTSHLDDKNQKRQNMYAKWRLTLINLAKFLKVIPKGIGQFLLIQTRFLLLTCYD
jgi:hypothetical protein